MVAPKAPEDGWKNWFTTHPYQRIRYPVVRAKDVTATWQMGEGGYDPPTSVSNFDIVEIWYDSANSKVCASLNGQSPHFVWVAGGIEMTWDLSVIKLFEYVINQKPETPPEPVGSGWDDFDWSK